MKRPLYTPRSRKSVDATMTPMIDVIFLLQIFFLCTTSFSTPESLLPTHLPNSGAVQVERRAPEERDFEAVRIRLAGHGDQFVVELNQRRLSGIPDLLEGLQRLGKVSKNLQVILEIGPDVVLDRLVQVYDGCLAAGLSRVNFAASKF